MDLDNGFDIRSYHQASNADLIEEFGIEVSEEEEQLYQDNCVPIDGKCPRKIFISGVDPKWVMAAQERRDALEKKEQFADRKKQRILKQKAALEQMKAKDKPEEKQDTEEENNEVLARSDSNEYFKVSARFEPSKAVKQPMASISTRSAKAEAPEPELKTNIFPTIFFLLSSYFVKHVWNPKLLSQI